jgi:hypothetical protein
MREKGERGGRDVGNIKKPRRQTYRERERMGDR